MDNNNKHWTEDDVQYLRDNYSKIDIEELSVRLERSVDAIRWKASELGLSAKVNYWSKDELIFLAENYTTLSYQEMSDKLGRTLRSVAHKIASLKITKLIKQKPKQLDAIEDDIPYYKGKSGEYRILLAALEIGQSFAYPAEDRQTIANQINYFDDKVFRTKRNDDKTRRVWRLL